MKTAIYIEDGLVQLVVTPETEFEKNSLSTFGEKPLEAKLFAGSFYDSRGGWVRQSAYRPNSRMFSNHDLETDDSLILTARRSEPFSLAGALWLARAPAVTVPRLKRDRK